MRTRTAKYSDYGISEQDKVEILKYCREAQGEGLDLIREVLKRIKSEYVAQLLYRNLTTGISYDKMAKTEQLYVVKEDFYGYRRKAISLLKKALK